MLNLSDDTSMTSHPQTDRSAIGPFTASNVGTEPVTQPDWVGRLAVIWGISGVVALLGFAIVRLLAISMTAFGFSFSWAHWLVLGASILFMAYTEGYRTFQKVWAPRVVTRAFKLRHNWTPTRLLLAPLYSMSFFHASRKRRVTAWVTTTCIVLLIVFMNQMPQPWRGLIDAGVVVGLSWGVAAVLYQTVSRLKA